MSEPKELKDVTKISTPASRQYTILTVQKDGSVVRMDPYRVLQTMMDCNGETGIITDLNEVTTAGIYLLDGNVTPLNAPPGLNCVVGIVEVLTRYGSSVIFQRVTAVFSGKTATRAWFRDTWSDWNVN